MCLNFKDNANIGYYCITCRDFELYFVNLLVIVIVPRLVRGVWRHLWERGGNVKRGGRLSSMKP
ncbi:hypothetical protein HMPREF9136_0470 [Prevotella dentalis DSM 3688]|uniref:Uncharacterized protein n=1 Tax=Prevotella dentalis (strain ATCC 49559 / DSM 3688 / JCM 13448 / NCTC 12043 / ES 2772) TaxID=908937 RepID=F9D0U2_PREDD|nr:hypothetical protein HMPREF9136_0470 [Prevotella dentalis DSM 3688]